MVSFQDEEGRFGVTTGSGVWSGHLRLDEAVLDTVRYFAENAKPIAAICHGPQILVAAGVLENRACSCYPAVSPEIAAAGGTYVEPAATMDSAR